MVMLQVVDVDSLFEEIETIKLNNWKVFCVFFIIFYYYKYQKFTLLNLNLYCFNNS